MANPARDILVAFTARDVVKGKRKLIEINADSSVQVALDIMQVNKIVSLPVWAPEGRFLSAGGNDVILNGKQYVGVITITDIALHLAFAESADDQVNRLAQKCVSLIGSTLEGQSIWITAPDKELLFASEPLSKHVHRTLVPVTENNEEHFVLLTQMDIVKFFQQKWSFFNIHESVAVACGEIHKRPGVLTIPHNVTALEAYRLMNSKGVIAAPVVDDEHKVVATLSDSDLRGISKETIDFLQLPVLRFIDAAKGIHSRVNACVTLEDSVTKVVAMVAEFGIHRVWVVDDQNKLVTVFSLTDIIHLVRTKASEQ